LVCAERGVNSAKPLFSHTKITGSPHSVARLIDSLKIPACTAPSPKNTTATWSPPRRRPASALPSASGMLPPTTPVAPISPCSTSTRCIEPPSPRQSPSARPISSAIARSSGAPAAIACPCARWPL
jgi:hypothetical protein